MLNHNNNNQNNGSASADMPPGGQNVNNIGANVSALAQQIAQHHANSAMNSGAQNSNFIDNIQQNMMNSPPRSKLLEVKHTMHGVSHAIPGEFDDIEKPLPVHYGVEAAIRTGSVALKTGNGNLSRQSRSGQHFQSHESLTSIVKEPSLARGQSTESIINVRVTPPIGEGLSPQISPQAKKIIPLRSSHETGNYYQLF